MYKSGLYQIAENAPLAREIYRMRLLGDTRWITAPGQFVNIRVDCGYLRRPISVCDWDAEGITLIYQAVGRGTRWLAGRAPGDTLDLLTGLGNGYDLAPARGKRVALIGGGVGVPPLYGLAKRLAREGEPPAVALGFRTADNAFLLEEFAALGCAVHIATEDGSLGEKGFVTGPLSRLGYGYYFACGPEPMLAALHALGREKGADGQLSFERRMGCGFGACMGCSCETLAGPKRICVEGPVLKSGEVRF